MGGMENNMQALFTQWIVQEFNFCLYPVISQSPTRFSWLAMADAMLYMLLVQKTMAGCCVSWLAHSRCALGHYCTVAALETMTCVCSDHNTTEDYRFNKAPACQSLVSKPWFSSQCLEYLRQRSIFSLFWNNFLSPFFLLPPNLECPIRPQSALAQSEFDLDQRVHWEHSSLRASFSGYTTPEHEECALTPHCTEKDIIAVFVPTWSCWAEWAREGWVAGSLTHWSALFSTPPLAACLPSWCNFLACAMSHRAWT